MRFHLTGTDPTPVASLVFSNGRWNLVIFLAALWAGPVVTWYLDAPRWLIYIFAALALLLTPPMIGSFRKLGTKENWVLALHPDGLWLNLRDCEYRGATPAESIVFVRYDEIRSARRAIHRYTTRDSDSTVHHKDVYLELELRADEAGLVKLALAEEQKREPPPQGCLGSFVTITAVRRRAPLDVVGENKLRVKFSAGNYGLTPPIKKVLRALERYVTIAEDDEPAKQHWNKLDDAEFDEMVLRLAQAGSRIEAIKLLTQRRGMTMTEAHVHVEALTAPPEDDTPDPA